MSRYVLDLRAVTRPPSPAPVFSRFLVALFPSDATALLRSFHSSAVGCCPPPHPLFFRLASPGRFCLGAVPFLDEPFRIPLDLSVSFVHVLSASLPLPSAFSSPMLNVKGSPSIRRTQSRSFPPTLLSPPTASPGKRFCSSFSSPMRMMRPAKNSLRLRRVAPMALVQLRL